MSIEAIPGTITGPLANVISQVLEEGPGPHGKFVSTEESLAEEKKINERELEEGANGGVYDDEP